ncbi:hypothetical protein [Labedaea rhizosphaerae]|uniref:Uncharacterized protein n=1 Tax=Labedaea rhizosphaerae TaxID=598644 RepID=A0A4R6RYD4_LABRH|nr:hypothetical protein [Labedaea rhizosphaerae]TDP91874.1 hypothetical protein EV186_10884 [Labedaea rhizosphaerae]
MGRSIGAVVAIAASLLLAAPGPAGAAGAADPLSVTVTVDGQSIADRTVAVEPSRPLALVITAVNGGDVDRQVRSVRFSGTALALTFFAYDITAQYTVPAHSSVTRTLVLDVADLDGQAVGLLPASVQLVDRDREVIGGVATVTDVRGSVWSVYGAFGIGALVLTVVAWASALLALARQRLSVNRWRRALRFGPAGIGTGLVAVVSLSVLRVVAPEPFVELPVVLGAGLAALLLGYLTPHPAGAPADDADYHGDLTVGLTTGVLDPATGPTEAMTTRRMDG